MNIFKYKNSLKKGFTLIELLVVISIIGLLSSVVLGSLNTARAKARDARRFSDMRQVQLALELYRDSNNGSYPAGSPVGARGNSCTPAIPPANAFNTQFGKWDIGAMQTLVTAGLLPQIPEDPLGSTFDSLPYPQFCYTYLVPTGSSIWYNCTNGGAPLDASLYSYILYFSTEATPGATEFRANWNGNTPPQNRCILGPLK